MPTARLGATAHCLRHEIARDGFEPVLAQLATLGIGTLEMSSLAGCRGNRWGDFGATTDRPPAELRAALHSAGLQCHATMVYAHEMVPGRMEGVFDWINALGCQRAVLAMFDGGLKPDGVVPPRSNYERALDQFDMLAAAMRAAGLEPVLHTQPDLWMRFGEWVPAEQLPARARAGSYMVELDPTGVLIHGGDATALAVALGEQLASLHLRDGARQARPTFYLPAEPLGTGDMDWLGCLAATAAQQPELILEMEMADPAGTWQALRSSVAWLDAHGPSHQEP